MTKSQRLPLCVLAMNAKIPSELDGVIESWAALPSELLRNNDTPCELLINQENG